MGGNFWATFDQVGGRAGGFKNGRPAHLYQLAFIKIDELWVVSRLSMYRGLLIDCTSCWSKNYTRAKLLT